MYNGIDEKILKIQDYFDSQWASVKKQRLK